MRLPSSYAKKIQSVWRGKLARKTSAEVRERMERELCAVLLMQGLARRTIAQRRAREARRLGKRDRVLYPVEDRVLEMVEAPDWAAQRGDAASLAALRPLEVWKGVDISIDTTHWTPLAGVAELRAYEDVLLAVCGETASPLLVMLGIDLRHLRASKSNPLLITSGSSSCKPITFSFKSGGAAQSFLRTVRFRVCRGFLEVNPLASTFPARTGHARCFAGGAEYYDRLCSAIEGARSTIFIADWWFSCEIYLRRAHRDLDTHRPFDRRDGERGASAVGAACPHDQQWRLDNLLQSRAQAGVRVFVLLYRPEVAVIDLGPERAKKYLEALDPRIRVRLHGPGVQHADKVFFSHHQKFCVVDQSIGFVGGIDLCVGRYDTAAHPLFDVEMPKNSAEDEQGFVHAYPDNPMVPPWELKGEHLRRPFVDPPVEQGFDRSSPLFPRMPWHDVHAEVVGLAARDVGLNFIQRWYAHGAGGGRVCAHSVEQLSPCETLVPIPRCVCLHRAERAVLSDEGVDEDAAAASHSPVRTSLSSCRVQVCRSIGAWSGSSAPAERSIYNTYCHAIRHAQRSIYIENQFWVSSVGSDSASAQFPAAGDGEGSSTNRVKNRVAQVLFKRLCAAIDAKEQFSVVVVLPEVPEGGVSSPSTQSVLHFQRKSLSRGHESLLGRLRQRYGGGKATAKVGKAADVDRYISFYSLRKAETHPIVEGLFSETVYVHSKLLIVDDRILCIGSANINDRSMRGSRDTELNLRILDTTNEGFVRRFRLRLMNRHAGRPEGSLEFAEIWRREVLASWRGVASANTELLERFVPGKPSDLIPSLAAWHATQRTLRSYCDKRIASTQKARAADHGRGVVVAVKSPAYIRRSSSQIQRESMVHFRISRSRSVSVVDRILTDVSDSTKAASERIASLSPPSHVAASAAAAAGRSVARFTQHVLTETSHLLGADGNAVGSARGGSSSSNDTISLIKSREEAEKVVRSLQGCLVLHAQHFLEDEHLRILGTKTAASVHWAENLDDVDVAGRVSGNRDYDELVYIACNSL